MSNWHYPALSLQNDLHPLRAFTLILAFYSHTQPLSLQNDLQPLRLFILNSGFLSTSSPTRETLQPLLKAPHLKLGCLSFRIEVQNTLSPEQTHFCVKLTLPSPQPPEWVGTLKVFYLILAFYSHTQPLSLQNELEPLRFFTWFWLFIHIFLPEKPFNPFKGTTPELGLLKLFRNWAQKHPISRADPFLCQTDTTQPSASRMTCTL